jgi:hypothetical protein
MKKSKDANLNGFVQKLKFIVSNFSENFRFFSIFLNDRHLRKILSPIAEK